MKEIAKMGKAQIEGGGEGGPQVQFVAPKRRWLMLALFAATSAANAAHWLQFAIIAGVVQCFYGVSATAVNWTSMIFMAAYVPLVFPASWITDKKGLRVAVALGAGLTSLGGWVKALGCAPDRFAVAFAGQAIVGAAQMFTLGAPARVASLWFGQGQVATACALGVLGNQVGIAVGFVLPPAVVWGGSEEEVGGQLFALHCALAAAPTLLFLLVICLFEAAPPERAQWPSPPPCVPALIPAPLLPLRASAEEEEEEEEEKEVFEEDEKQQKQLEDKDEMIHTYDAEAAGGRLDAVGDWRGSRRSRLEFGASLAELARSRDFLLLWCAYGLNVGVFYAVSTLLSQMMVSHFPGAEADAGRVGLVMVVAGAAGSATGGVVLDRWRRFKATTLATYALALAALLAFSLALTASGSLTLVYVSAAMLGFFTTGYLGVGYEYAAALSPRVAESTSSGMLNAASEVMGIALTACAGILLELWGDRITLIMLAAVLALGFVLSALVRGARLVRPALPARPPEKFLG